MVGTPHRSRIGAGEPRLRRAAGACWLASLLLWGCGYAATAIVICHVPPGNPDNGQTLDLPPDAVRAHLREHPEDHRGPCEGDTTSTSTTSSTTTTSTPTTTSSTTTSPAGPSTSVNVTTTTAVVSTTSTSVAPTSTAP